MRSLAYVTTTFPTLAAFLENEVHRLVARGVRVRVLTLRAVSAQYQPQHAPLVALTRPVGSPLDPRGWWALAAWLVRRPHVLLPEAARLLWASRGSAYALAGHLAYLPAAARVASLVEREDLEVVHGAWAHFPASVAYLAARLTGRRFTMAAHAGSDVHRTRAFLAEKVRAAEFTAACVRGNAELLRALAPGARVELIHHGVDLARFDGAGRARDPEPLFVVVGRLAVPKGFDLAVRALGALARRGRAARLVVVGEGPERATLESLARAEGVAERVTFTGALDHARLLPWYRRAWALLAPCRVMGNGRQDGIPNVVVEAMAMGVPCVGTRAAGLEEAILPGVTGALAAPEDAEGLADGLAALIDDPASVERMGAEARRRALAGFDVEASFARLAALWDGAPARGARMRVAHVIEAMHTGGAESLILEHVRCAGPGVETLVVALNRGGPALERAAALGARVHVLRRPGALARLAAPFDLARRLRQGRVDVVNGHNPSGALYGLLGARLAGVPVVVRTEHSLHYPGRHSAVYPLLERLATLLTRRVVCVCRAVRDSHVRRLPWASRRFVTVANGIAPAPHTRPREEVRRSLGLGPGEVAVLTIGSLTRQKAQHVLLQAFAAAARTRPAARLLIAGEGPLRADLERRVADAGLGGRVSLLGARADVADLLEACDLFALTSVREGLPVTLLEAMRAARAAVVTDIGGCAEAVDDGVTGRVVPVGDVAALAAALGALIDDPAARAEQGRSARARWEERFTAERMVRETEALYRECLAEAGRPAAGEGGGHAAA